MPFRIGRGLQQPVQQAHTFSQAGAQGQHLPADLLPFLLVGDRPGDALLAPGIQPEDQALGRQL